MAKKQISWKPENWKPQDALRIILSDETALDRSEVEFDDMIGEIREVANRYGFDLLSFGRNDDFENDESSENP